jgi:hypothetical protein
MADVLDGMSAVFVARAVALSEIVSRKGKTCIAPHNDRCWRMSPQVDFDTDFAKRIGV